MAGTFLRVQDQLGWAKQRVADVRDTVAALGAAEGSVFSVELHRVRRRDRQSGLCGHRKPTSKSPTAWRIALMTLSTTFA
ncbi:MAG TPA: hypothetical protein VHN56_09215 [Actinomycetota bacterium]|nr:hypothetical protein [Actinomycetota bacterium]